MTAELARQGIEVIEGRARFVDPHAISISGRDAPLRVSERVDSCGAIRLGNGEADGHGFPEHCSAQRRGITGLRQVPGPAQYHPRTLMFTERVVRVAEIR